jgi:membrane-associated protein
MSWLFDSLIAFGAAHPHAIGTLAFLAALLESLAIVGAVFPGSIALIALGALVPTGAIGVVPLLAFRDCGRDRRRRPLLLARASLPRADPALAAVS